MPTIEDQVGDAIRDAILQAVGKSIKSTARRDKERMLEATLKEHPELLGVMQKILDRAKGH